MFLLPSNTPSRIIAVPSELIPLAGDGNSALFLAQVLFWWKAKGRQKFYKFNAPCGHALYRTGDSWQEELGLRRTMFMTARRRVAVKVRITCRDAVQQAFDEGALVVYGTDEYHLTWYIVNEAALKHRSPSLYARLLRVEPAPDSTANPRPDSTPRTTPAERSRTALQPRVLSPTGRPATVAPPPAGVAVSRRVRSAPSEVGAEGRRSPLAEGEGLHSLMQGACTGSTESPSEIAPEPASDISLETPFPSKTIPLPAPPDTVGEGVARAGQRVESAIFTGLQARGVQEGPAWRIARRAVRAGWDADRTLAVFDAHHVDAKRAGVRSPVAVAVARMVKNEQIALPPAETFLRVQWLNEARGAEAQPPAGDDGGSRRDSGSGGLQTDEGGGGQGANRQDIRHNAAEPRHQLPHLASLWYRVLGDIKLQVTRATYEQRFKGTWLEQRGATYVVCACDPHTVEWLAHRLKGLVTRTLERCAGGTIQPEFACG